MNKYEIEQFRKEHGVHGFVDALGCLLEGVKLPNGYDKRIDPFALSVGSMWEALVGSIGETLPLRGNLAEAGALDHTGFPTATEKLIATVMIREYDRHRGVADQLVPNSYEPRTLTERIPGFTSLDTPKNVLPGEDYPMSTFADKFATYEEALHNKKEGIELAMTEEVVRFDQTGMILRRAQNIGRNIQIERERRTVRAILGIGKETGTDLNGVYFPSGTDTALYRASENNLRTNAAPIFNHPGKTADSKLEDYTDLQEVLTVHAQNIKDDRQLGTTRPIAWNPNAILTPMALASTGANIVNATQILWNRNTAADPELRTSSPNPLASMFAAFGANLPTPVSSVYADEVSSTVWVMYDRESAFLRINIFPFQVFRSPAGYGWKNDVLVSFRAREWTRVVALDHKLAVRNNGA